MAGKINLRSNDNMEFSIDVDLAKVLLSYFCRPSCRNSRCQDILKNRKSPLLATLLLPNVKSAFLKEIGNKSPPMTTLPLPDVKGATLKKVIEWCDHHRTDYEKFAEEEDESTQPRLDDIPDWDVSFFNIDQAEIFEIIMAAYHLNIKGLLNIGCKTVANMIKGKTPEEIRQTFNIKNDFTPEEEEQIRKENEWCNEK